MGFLNSCLEKKKVIRQNFLWLSKIPVLAKVCDVVGCSMILCQGGYLGITTLIFWMKPPYHSRLSLPCLNQTCICCCLQESQLSLRAMWWSLIILFHAFNLSVCLSQRRTRLQCPCWWPLECKAALALLSCSQISGSGTMSSVTPGPADLLAVLSQFLPVPLKYFLPKHCQNVHNSTNRALSDG